LSGARKNDYRISGQEMAAKDDDYLLDSETISATKWDEDEWEWK